MNGKILQYLLLPRGRSLTVAALMVVAMFGTGCANLEQTAYRSIGTTAVLVDGAMSGWGDYVKAGQAKPNEEAAVKGAYEKYQRAMWSARTAVRVVKGAPEGQAALTTALQVLSASSGELIALIEALAGGPPKGGTPN